MLPCAREILPGILELLVCISGFQVCFRELLACLQRILVCFREFLACAGQILVWISRILACLRRILSKIGGAPVGISRRLDRYRCSLARDSPVPVFSRPLRLGYCVFSVRDRLESLSYEGGPQYALSPEAPKQHGTHRSIGTGWKHCPTKAAPRFAVSENLLHSPAGGFYSSGRND